MKMNLFKSTILFFLLIMACNHIKDEKTEKLFLSSQFVKTQSIYIDEIIKPDHIYKLKDYIILKDGQANHEYFFYVYSYPDFEFKYAFGKWGNGPQEYMMPTVIKGTSDNHFAFRDHATDTYASYLITDTGSVLMDSYHLPPYDDKFFWEINQISDSLYFLKRSDSRWSRREVWNFNSPELIDSIPNTFNLSKLLGKNYYTEFDDHWITTYDDKFAVGYFFMDLLEIGNVRDGRISLRKRLGISSPPSFYLFKDAKPGDKFQYNVDNNIVYYEYLTSGQKYIYGLYCGLPWGDMETSHSSLIEIWSWDGEAVSLLELEKSISVFAVDEEQKLIFGLNNEEGEDHIYKYKFE